MKTVYWVLIACGIVFFLAFGMFIGSLGEPTNSNQSENARIVEDALIRETSSGYEGVCNEYKLTNNKITLWCVDGLVPNACYVIASRIASDMEGLQGSVEYDIACRGWHTRDTINVLYDYKLN